MGRLAHHAVYNVSTTGVNVLSIEMVIDIIFLHVLHTIPFLKFVLKCLGYQAQSFHYANTPMYVCVIQFRPCCQALRLGTLDLTH